jgi:hypothetical protein
MLDDGTYNVFIVDASVTVGENARIVELEVTITSGDFKGDVVSIRADGLAGEEWELLGTPATLVVTDGAPHLRLDS